MSKNVLHDYLKDSVLTLLAHLGPLHSKKYQTMLILAFEANSALSRENETKIVKITHSASCGDLL